MACEVNTRQLYCTTSDVHFGPVFDSDDDAEAFRTWEYQHYGDPRQFSSLKLSIHVEKWKQERKVQQ